MKPTYPRLPDAELEVMKALWALGDYPAHTGDIAQKLDKSWKAPTLLKLLSRLEERRFVAGTKEGRANAYTPPGEGGRLPLQREPLLPGAPARGLPVQSGGLPVSGRKTDRGGRGRPGADFREGGEVRCWTI